MAQTIDAVAIRRHLSQKTIQELCDDYEHLVSQRHRMAWAEDAVSSELADRDAKSWLLWTFDATVFGHPRPHRYFGLV
ncbi:hypothetical protein ACFVYF_18970 [Streptomyces sp. NPDC058274]|uniref:hypothetical protein n=1 Tax=Streptomyces sp. NPDC058274 TaxID=3346416 RepID=UPI0036DFC5EC